MRTRLLASILALAALASCGGAQKQNTAENPQTTDARTQILEYARTANIYEVNVRQYTPEGTFKAFKEHLQRLDAMEVDIIWLMPITPISVDGRKGSLGSYYAVRNYTEVNPEFGNLSDLKELVSEAHKLGMRVIIDWVANHTGRDNEWTKNHKDWFNQDSLGNIICPAGTDWTDVSDLNYDNAEMRQAMIDAMKFWVSNADIDGFRCDMAGMVPVDFWVEARRQLMELKPVFMLAEDNTPEIHKAFDVSYNWEIHHCLNDIAQGKKNADSLIDIWNSKAARFQKGDLWLNFTSNHDENSWSGTEYDRMGEYVEMMSALTYCLPGMPLTYSGQEAANRKSLRFFDKDTIDFSNLPMQQFYSRWNQTKRHDKCLQSSDIEFIRQNPDVLMFTRGQGEDCALFIFNFGPETTIDINGQFLDPKSKAPISGPYTIGARQYKIFGKK